MVTSGIGFGTERPADRQPILVARNVGSKMDRLDLVLLDDRLPVQPHLQHDVYVNGPTID